MILNVAPASKGGAHSPLFYVAGIGFAFSYKQECGSDPIPTTERSVIFFKYFLLWLGPERLEIRVPARNVAMACWDEKGMIV